MHRNARLTVWARKEIVQRRQRGWTLAEIARQLNVSRPTVSKWWHRFLASPDGDWYSANIASHSHPTRTFSTNSPTSVCEKAPPASIAWTTTPTNTTTKPSHSPSPPTASSPDPADSNTDGVEQRRHDAARNPAWAPGPHRIIPSRPPQVVGFEAKHTDAPRMAAAHIACGLRRPPNKCRSRALEERGVIAHIGCGLRGWTQVTGAGRQSGSGITAGRCA